jgi:hypothetical protein
MTARPTDPPALPPEVAGLKRRFVQLMILQGVLGAGAIAFALAYFLLRQSWGLPAFVVCLGLALAAQVRFIWIFKNRRG